MEALLKEIQSELKKTNEILSFGYQQKNPNELLTAEQVHKEFNIGINMVRKMFKDSKLNVQTYTTPFKVTRQAMNEYLNQRHDYLSERK